MVDSYQFVRILSNKLPEDAIVVCGNGTACVAYFQVGIVKKGQRVIWNSGCAAMGWACSAAVGASFANPGKPIICIEGDGSLMMNIQSLQIVKHYNLPIKIFLMNNSGYHSLQETYDNFCDGKHYGSDIGDLSFPDWENVANTFGLKFDQAAYPEYLENHIDYVLNQDKAILFEIVLGDYKFRKQEL